uniref:D-alanyl-D-alanine endopeptidase (DD-endopeptidase) (Penicillin-binding protein 5) (PBP-5) n=1 Tax=mine drainage metagenome TaxID=410659 RepID=E6QR87_9ZZZZ
MKWISTFLLLSVLPGLAISVPAGADEVVGGQLVAMAEPQPLPDQPRLSALSVLVLDEATGSTLLDKNPDLETPIASISKLMTAMVVLDAKQPMNEKLAVTDADVDKLRHSSSRLAVGTVLTRAQMFHLALIASENRAAFALARNYPGGEEKCIQAMNRKAKALGMTHTVFEDPTGLTSHNQSTAEDLAKMVQAAAGYQVIHEITTTAHYQITRTARVKVRQRHAHHRSVVWRSVTQEVAFNNTNPLVREGHWDIGLSKTGFINEAGHCLVMQAKIASKRVVIVILDSMGKYGRINDAKRIRQWVEAHVKHNEVASAASDLLP